jgi:hypothetical protein
MRTVFHNAVASPRYAVLDIKALMSEVLRLDRRKQYRLDLVWNFGDRVRMDLQVEPNKKATLWIKMDWPPQGLLPAHGRMLLRYPKWDDRLTEQMLLLTGMPAKVGKWRWSVLCTDAQKRVSKLFLTENGERFVSRVAAGVKYRSARSKEARFWHRRDELLRKLGVDEWAPFIAKPKKMSRREYSEVSEELSTMMLSAMCKALEIYGTDVSDQAKPKMPKLRNRVANKTSHYRDSKGGLHLKARFKKKPRTPKVRTDR